jgi:hypothetical protein
MMSFYWQGRFSEKPSDIFKRYYADAMRHHRFMESPARLGQLRLSLERKNELVPKESVRGLVKALDAMERERIVNARTKQWNVVHWGSKLKPGKASASGQSGRPKLTSSYV